MGNQSSNAEDSSVVKVLLKDPRDKNKLAIVVKNVFTKQECENLIDRTEKAGYVEALVNIGGGRETLMTDYRNSQRCIIDDMEFAGILSERLGNYIPKELKRKQYANINERMRFLKYYPGHFFKPHCDSSYFRPENGEVSLITILLYLNEEFEGGTTRFYDRRERYYTDLKPKTGSVLIFQHDLVHEGVEVKTGVKYVLRTDIMYADMPIDRKNLSGNIVNNNESNDDEIDLT